MSNVNSDKKYYIKTLGCKANYADGQLLEVGLSEQGYAPANRSDQADVVIVNSCTVTDEADKQSQKWVRDLHKKNPHAKIIYTGCAAEVDPELALKIPGVSAVVGNQDKQVAAKLIFDYVSAAARVEKDKPEAPVILGNVAGYDEIASRHPMDREWPLPDDRLETVIKLGNESVTFRTRVFLKVQEGCDSFCTYCIIPYGRGPARSLPIPALLEKVQALVAQGIQEIVLTGTNIGDYGLDFAGQLMIDDLIEAILTKTHLKRLRVGSLDPTEISPRMIALMEQHEAFCPHFHVSLQHVDSKILKLMKRKYSFEQAERCLSALSQMNRKPFVGMDYITGFPGETDQDFEKSVDVLKSLYWSRLHVFPYSEREGTPATKLPHKVAPSVRKERARILQKMSLDQLTQSFSHRRSNHQNLLKGVLLEGRFKGPDGTRDWVAGFTPDYQRVVLPMKTPKHIRTWNEVVEVQVGQWVVDRASGDVSWLGSLEGRS